MSIDVYLQIEGIKGESVDEGKGGTNHKDWIECLAVNFEVLQPRSATASTAGGHTAERCEHKDIIVSKLCDLATPKLLEYCSSGKTLPKATLEFMRADGDGNRVKYFSIQLKNVLISGVAPSVAEGSIMTESLSLKYAEVLWKYEKQKIGGGMSGNSAGGWDLSKNVVAK
jgi:type VI secretion system secreted protein Hcp